jgi:hypothetical protein
MSCKGSSSGCSVIKKCCDKLLNDLVPPRAQMLTRRSAHNAPHGALRPRFTRPAAGTTGLLTEWCQQDQRSMVGVHSAPYRRDSHEP